MKFQTVVTENNDQGMRDATIEELYENVCNYSETFGEEAFDNGSDDNNEMMEEIKKLENWAIHAEVGDKYLFSNCVVERTE